MITGEQIAAQARRGNYIGIPYKQLDCQAFVEKVLIDCGIRDESGKKYNWRGSNHIWREAVENRRPVTNSPKVGAAVFTIKNDGGEKARGYRDDMKNAAHIGLYLGDGVVMHSTTGGVQYDVITSSRWTHTADFVFADYSENSRCCDCECC